MESGHLENGDIDVTIPTDLGESADFQAAHVQADKPGSEKRSRKKRKINVSHTYTVLS